MGRKDESRMSAKAQPLYQRYLGTLGLLAECSVYVPEDIREGIAKAFTEACQADEGLVQRSILDRMEIEALFQKSPMQRRILDRMEIEALFQKSPKRTTA
jgi:hypothetical protein